MGSLCSVKEDTNTNTQDTHKKKKKTQTSFSSFNCPRRLLNCGDCRFRRLGRSGSQWIWCWRWPGLSGWCLSWLSSVRPRRQLPAPELPCQRRPETHYTGHTIPCHLHHFSPTSGTPRGSQVTHRILFIIRL